MVDPTLFLHRIDFDTGVASLVDADPDVLRAASFHDGRERFWRGEPREWPLTELLREAARAVVPIERYIFHVGFCGSTLLARMIDQPGHALVLREPQALTDIAAYRSALASAGVGDARSASVLSATRAMLARNLMPGEPIVIKPSSWINNLLPALCAQPATIHPLFLDISRNGFLVAALRGGSRRLDYIARAALHYSHARDMDARCLAAALRSDGDQLDKLLLLTVLAFHFQKDLFARALAAGGWDRKHMLTMEDIRTDPVAALEKAAIALNLSIESAAPWERRHAKQPDAAFSWEEQDAVDGRIATEYGARIERACTWADRWFAKLSDSVG